MSPGGTLLLLLNGSAPKTPARVLVAAPPRVLPSRGRATVLRIPGPAIPPPVAPTSRPGAIAPPIVRAVRIGRPMVRGPLPLFARAAPPVVTAVRVRRPLARGPQPGGATVPPPPPPPPVSTRAIVAPPIVRAVRVRRPLVRGPLSLVPKPAPPVVAAVRVRRPLVRGPQPGGNVPAVAPPASSSTRPVPRVVIGAPAPFRRATPPAGRVLAAPIRRAALVQTIDLGTWLYLQSQTSPSSTRPIPRVLVGQSVSRPAAARQATVLMPVPARPRRPAAVIVGASTPRPPAPGRAAVLAWASRPAIAPPSTRPAPRVLRATAAVPRRGTATVLRVPPAAIAPPPVVRPPIRVLVATGTARPPGKATVLRVPPAAVAPPPPTRPAPRVLVAVGRMPWPGQATVLRVPPAAMATAVVTRPVARVLIATGTVPRPGTATVLRATRVRPGQAPRVLRPATLPAAPQAGRTYRVAVPPAAVPPTRPVPRVLMTPPRAPLPGRATVLRVPPPYVPPPPYATPLYRVVLPATLRPGPRASRVLLVPVPPPESRDMGGFGPTWFVAELEVLDDRLTTPDIGAIELEDA